MALRRGGVTDIPWFWVGVGGGGGGGGVGNKVSHISSTLHRVVNMAWSHHSLGC